VCNTADRCPAGSYRGKDCQCYCSNDDKDNNNPTVICNSGQLILSLNNFSHPIVNKVYSTTIIKLQQKYNLYYFKENYPAK